MAKAKAKAQKGSGGGAQSHLRARLSYLHRASLLFQSIRDELPTAPAQTESAPGTTDIRKADSHCDEHSRAPSASPSKDILGHHEAPCLTEPSSQDQTPHPSYLSRQYASQLQAVSLKSQLRLPRDVKQSFCKRCHTVLVPGSTCTKGIENKSRGGKKLWADVLVIGCGVCGAKKRYPQGQKRTMRLVDRRRNAESKTQVQMNVDV